MIDNRLKLERNRQQTIQAQRIIQQVTQADSQSNGIAAAVDYDASQGRRIAVTPEGRVVAASDLNITLRGTGDAVAISKTGSDVLGDWL